MTSGEDSQSQSVSVFTTDGTGVNVKNEISSGQKFDEGDTALATA